MRVEVLIAALCCVVLVGCTDKRPASIAGPLDGHLVELTHDFADDTVYWVNAEPFRRVSTAEGMTPGGYFYAAGNYSAAEHGGTHIDAPIHFAEGRNTADKIPLDQLIGAAMTVDVSARAAANADYLISVDDLTNWEAANGRIPDGAILLLRTGFGSFWPDKKRYLGTDQRGDAAAKDLHFPGLDPKAAAWLTTERKVKAVGIDTASIDRGQSTTFESHVALMTKNIPAFENVANLDKLPATGAYVIALPMKIRGGSGAPLRIVGLVPSK